MRHIFWLEENSLAGRAGPRKEPWAETELRAAGFDVVLNLSEHEPAVEVFAAAGLAQHWTPLPNAVPPTPESEQECARVLPLALQFLQERLVSGHRVLVHCYAGQDRTGLLLALYLAQRDGLAAFEAIARVRFVRPAAITAPGWEAMALRVIPTVLGNAGLPPITADYCGRMPAVAEAMELQTVGKDASGREARLAPRAAVAWRHLLDAANTTGVTLRLLSTFRSVARQRELVLRKRAAGHTWDEIWAVNARPGHSEHHSGCAVDLGSPDGPALDDAFALTPQYRWLQQHAGRFGFTLSYPRDNARGITFEPWHWCWHPPA